MTGTDLDVRLDAISRLQSPATRGRELEDFVAEVFRQSHFKVTLNSGVARPRQTDVLATRDTETFLIECKWRSGRADINDLDSLRSRLGRTNSDVVGILLSFPGFAGSVLSDVEHHRHQPIFLISGDELRLISSGLESLTKLLWRKKDALLTDGTVLLDEPFKKRSAVRRRFELPKAEGQFMWPDSVRSQVIECVGQFGQFVFAHKLPDIDWVPASGNGVTLDVSPTILSQSDLLDLVDKLAAMGWATPDARWSMQQANRNWHGLGCAAFANQLTLWQQRADTPDAHHSEEICYLDRCDGGFYTLTANLASHRIRQATAVTLSFQLEGLPLDTAPLLQLCRSIGAHESLYFRPRTERSVARSRAPHITVKDVQALAYLIGPERLLSDAPTEWVTGIVITNPFYATPASKRTAELPVGLELIQDSQHLICDLAEHHKLDDLSRYTYEFQGFESARTSGALVCRPIANWNHQDDAARDAARPPRRTSAQ
ncbi:restriction endonuclease [Amycolatopsis dendrobii]|uniref:Restriction endonuclease n=1 Tax=Amycolatopsis dendrobii TaxID=2760662 RepID=A0A7W3VTE3_9PSEU|nr:restriction endonuclease [Amycolatopsis dendrobii]MBB1152512.1 restriction endonuclease [Amycolatopsis dendrobii]